MTELGVDYVNLEGGIFQRQYFLFVGGKPTKHLEYFENVGLIYNPKVNNGKTGKKIAYDVLKEVI